MSSSLISRKYTVQGTAETVRQTVHELLLSGGLVQTGITDGVMHFRHPSLTFSSKRPLSCISHLTVGVHDNSGSVSVHIGASFTKIRYYTITVVVFLCFVLPAVISYVEHGIIVIPPMAYLGLPLGFMVHYHVRWRVFHTLQRLIQQAGG